jgi:Kef-type K+ transport system membrane component KefB
MNDIVNAVFEFGMACALTLNLYRLWRDKQVRGISLWGVVWPTMWGYWNLYYYPSLGQTASFIAGVFVVATNTSWVLLALKYKRQRAHD